jgi:tetratricopeptide (TPR) repeat protein
MYSEAIRLLKNNEKGRFYARALTGMADLKCALGDFQDSLEIYKEAITVLERYDLRSDIADGKLKLARALIKLQRLDRAEKLAEEARNLRQGDPGGESDAIAVLVLVALQRNEFEGASERATAAVDLSDKGASTQSRIRARVALGLVKLAEREFKEATDALGAAAEMARNSVGAIARRLELEATIYLAEGYHSVDTRAGRAELVRASELLNQVEDAFLGDEFNRVSAKYESRSSSP